MFPFFSGSVMFLTPSLIVLCDEICIFSFVAVLKYYQVPYMRRKMPFTVFSFLSRDIQVFKICKLAK